MLPPRLWMKFHEPLPRQWHRFNYEHVPVYKLLGIDHDTSEEEIRGAMNFLIQQCQTGAAWC